MTDIEQARRISNAEYQKEWRMRNPDKWQAIYARRKAKIEAKKKHCPFCGVVVKEKQRFCCECGEKLL